MRVLNVVHAMEPGGGIETFLRNLFEEMAGLDLELEVCCVSGRPGGLAPELEKLGVKVWTCRQGRNPYGFMQRFRQRLVQDGPYEVVHTHTMHYGGPALWVARRVGVPVRIAHYHNAKSGHSRDLKRQMYDLGMRQMVRRCATGIFGCSWASVEACFPTQWTTDSRMGVIRLGIPTTIFQNNGDGEEIRSEFDIPFNTPVIGHIGRFHPQKNHQGLIEAAKLVVQRLPGVRFLLVGDGPLRAEIEEKVVQLGLNRNVVFTGLRKDVPRLLSAMDLFVLPSLWEGFGLVLVEAQCAGVPVMASSISPVREAIAPVFHQYLGDPDDAPGLADAMVQLLERSQCEPDLQEAACAFGSRFTIQSSARAMLAAWGYPGAVVPPDPAGWPRPGLAQTTSEISETAEACY